MKKLVLSGLCCASLMALLPETGHAHGGQYRGPGDVVPPPPGGGGGRSGGPSGPTTGGPSGPSAPGPSGPSTGGPAGPTTGGPSGGGGGKGPTTGGRGGSIEDDLNEWLYWWEFNKDPFIRLKDAVQSGGAATGSDDFYLGNGRRSDARDSLKPTHEQIIGEILPALKKAIDSTDDKDINSSCMVAMAKVGTDHPDFKLIDVFTPRLRKNNQEVRETAALSIGIAALGNESDVTMLVDLALDKEKGREKIGGSVGYRERSFALYGLGLTAYKTTKVEIKKIAFDAMKDVLLDDRMGNRDIKVAAINGMSILNLGTGSDAEKALLEDALNALKTYYEKGLGSGEQLIQSHVPTAIAKLIGREHARSEEFREMFALDLQEKGKVKRSSVYISQSCAMALGVMARPNEDEKDNKKSPDAKYSKLLLDTWHDHKDIQTRNYALMSLGLIGGSQNRAALLKEFDKASKETEKPWCSLALGVYSFFLNEQSSGSRPEGLDFIGETLFKTLKDAKTPALTGSLAIGLGLNKYKDAADEMRNRMKDMAKSQEQVAGYLCIGLALMNDRTSIEEIRRVVQEAVRRPDLLKQAAIALGKLGDKRVAEDLQNLLKEGETNLAKLSSIASALGFIGDSRTITPLKAILFDDKLTELSRAFAAVALGGVADKEPLPWNSKIAQNINYRASVETLTNKSTGILDIL